MDPEINAMSKVAEALEVLDSDARSRVLKWAANRYKAAIVTEITSDSNSSGDNDKDDETNDEQQGNSTGEKYETFAELFADASPSTPAEKVLVAGYWHQVVGGQSFITSSPLNKDLKDLGHAVSNISEKFDSLMGTKPQLAIQLKKSGSSRQARKQYKITKAGLDKVNNMLGN